MNLSKLTKKCLLIFTLLFVASCSKHSSGGGKSMSTVEAPSVSGNYSVHFSALNTSVSGLTQAEAKMHLFGDQFSVTLEVKDTAPLTVHQQNLYYASECPSEKDDLNDDGFIDSRELSKLVGQVLIPLDDNISNQDEGLQLYPHSDAFGSYLYTKEDSFFRMISDLFSPDMNLKDNIRKLSSGQPFVLVGKVVVLFGIQEDLYLPGSVQSVDDESERSSLPIACGVIKRSSMTEPELGEGENSMN